MQQKKRNQNSQTKISGKDKELIDLVRQSEPDVAKKFRDTELARVTRAISGVSHYSGPLPPPDLLHEFNEVIPNGAERIVKQFEEQSSHRREIEKVIICSQQKRSDIGQWLGFVLALVCIGSSVYLALRGHTTVASFLGSSTVIGLATTFVFGKLIQNKNLKEKP